MQDFQRRLIDAAQTQASMQDTILKNKTRTGKTPIMVQNYSYVGQASAVAPVAAPGTPTQVVIPTNGDSDFIIVYMAGLVFNTATQANIAAPLAQVQITDNSSQRAMFSNPVLFNTVFGQGGFPYILQEPRLITANTQIIVQYYNLMSVAAIATDMQVVFSGYRVYY